MLMNSTKNLIEDQDGVLMSRKTASLTLKKAAEKLNTTVSTINKILKIAKEHGPDALQMVKWGSGRPRHQSATILPVRQLNWLASKPILRGQIGLSLKARCAQFNMYW